MDNDLRRLDEIRTRRLALEARAAELGPRNGAEPPHATLERDAITREMLQLFDELMAMNGELPN